MLFYLIIQLALIFSICHSSIAYGMENITNTQLSIPLIIQKHSDYLKMLANNGQADFHRKPLMWPDTSTSNSRSTEWICRKISTKF